MVVVSYSGKEINAKLVYYGAGLSGKTTNLEAIYEAVPEVSRGKMVSMKTQSDRTLFFDLLPLDLGEIMGFKTRFLLYTVPGQVFYNATRKLVLKGADAIVFVADSEVGKMEENKDSLANLRNNLAEYSVSLDHLPWVIQYNKRDLPNLYTLEELNAELNPGGKAPFFEAVATQGKGVFETFRGISHLLMEKVTKDLRRTPFATPATKPVIEEAAAARPEPVRAAAPPMAPAHAMAPEAREPVGPLATEEEAGGLDYGREIVLPDEVPPAPAPAVASAPVREAAPKPAPEPAVAMAAPPAPNAPPARSKPARAEPAEAPASVVAPAVALSEAPAAAAHERPQPAVVESAGEPQTTQTAHALARTVQAAQAAQPAVARAPEPLVVPLTLPRNGSYEIVIRVVLKDGD